jgi:hypothetical protein
MRRRLIAICLTLVAAAALVLVPAASAAKKQASTPAISRVLPMRLGVGETLTIRGKNFSTNRKRNTVIFRAPSGRTAFAKPTKASKTKLVLVVPGAVSRLLGKVAGSSAPTRFSLRVLSGTFSKFTSRRLSPVITGLGSGGGGNGNGGGGPGSPADAACPGTDSDNDLLPNSVELELKTDPCLSDTDGDGVEDGYEFKSAVDLNDDDYQEPQSSLPYPGKRPYPNPLDPTDAIVDFDGDSLTLGEEQQLWHYTIANGATRTLTPLTYSDGEQHSVSIRNGSGRRQPTLAATGYAKQVGFLSWASTHGYRNPVLQDGYPWAASGLNTYGLLDMNRDGVEDATIPPPGYGTPPPDSYIYTESTYYDFNLDGWLSDDERDEDGDGLTNYDETHGRMTPEYWDGCYTGEAPYAVVYAGTSFVDPDSDGDGVLDGADDQDHDDVPNVMELSRNAASGEIDWKFQCRPLDSLPTPPATLHFTVYGRVNPFNPCLPATFSRTCTLHPGINGSGAPFDESLNWASLN